MSRSVIGERERQRQQKEGACATLTPGAPDDSTVARWALLNAQTYSNMPTHVHKHTNTYWAHIHNYCFLHPRTLCFFTFLHNQHMHK